MEIPVMVEMDTMQTYEVIEINARWNNVTINAYWDFWEWDSWYILDMYSPNINHFLIWSNMISVANLKLLDADI